MMMEMKREAVGEEAVASLFSMDGEGR